MFTPEMMESVKKVEATRAARLGVEPRRMRSSILITGKRHLQRSK